MRALGHGVFKLERLRFIACRESRRMKTRGVLYTLTVALWVVAACQMLIIIGGAA